MSWIYVWASEIKNIYVWTTPVKEVYVWTTKVRPTTPPYLCFTANTAESTVALIRSWWTPPAISLEISTDWNTWSDYTVWTTITLPTVWSKVFWRTKSTTDATFSTNTSPNYQFQMTWSIAWSWNIQYLLNKNWTNTASAYCFASLFRQCAALTSLPSFPATTLNTGCYYFMCYQCTWLTTLPKLPATTIPTNAYYWMFRWCTNIKLSATKTWIYQTAYRIPTTWTWSAWTNALYQMFRDTWWTYTWAPNINTTYYTSNTLV